MKTCPFYNHYWRGMANSVLSHVADSVRHLSPYAPGRPIEEVAAERGITDVIKLASNENPLGASMAAVRALQNLSAAAVGRYPDGNCAQLRAAVAKRLSVGADELIFGNGSNEILELAAQLVLTENDVGVYSRHGFAVYGLAIAARRARAIVVAAADDYGHDLTAIAEQTKAHRARLVFVANPNNPTGSWHCAAAINDFMQQIAPDVLVVLDEAYREYVDGKDELSGARFPNLLITRTFSKIHGLAGLRIGYGIGDVKLIAMLNRLRQPFNVSGAAQSAAAAALADDAHVSHSVRINAAGLKQIVAGLEDLRLRYMPSRANFITFAAADVGAATRIYEGLLNVGIIIRPLAGYDLPEWLRVTIGTEQENRRFLLELARLL